MHVVASCGRMYVQLSGTQIAIFVVYVTYRDTKLLKVKVPARNIFWDNRLTEPHFVHVQMDLVCMATVASVI